KAEELMMIPRTVSAPSNAPMTKYRRMIGPTFVISSYSRSRRRQARKSMSSALDPEFLPDEFLKFRGGGARHVDVRETRLRDLGLHDRPRALRGLDFLFRLRGGPFIGRFLGNLAELLPFAHDPLRRGDDLIRRSRQDLADAPQVFRLLADGLEGSFPGGVFESHDPVLNARG